MRCSNCGLNNGKDSAHRIVDDELVWECEGCEKFTAVFISRDGRERKLDDLKSEGIREKSKGKEQKVEDGGQRQGQ